MTKQHTPGPWQVQQRKADNAYSSAMPEIWGDSGVVIADIRWNGHNEKHGTANARLIAAAPDLLAALREYVERHEAEGASPGLPEYDQACAAIAKAEGR